MPDMCNKQCSFLVKVLGQMGQIVHWDEKLSKHNKKKDGRLRNKNCYTVKSFRNKNR